MSKTPKAEIKIEPTKVIKIDPSILKNTSPEIKMIVKGIKKVK